MGTTIRSELSPNSKYWLEKHRYYELKHFCLQYPLWKKAYLALSGLSARPIEVAIYSGPHGDPTARTAQERIFYLDRMKVVEQCAIATDADLHSYILRGVTEGIAYDYLKARLEIPCCKDVYYGLYRRFFWLLDKERL